MTHEATMLVVTLVFVIHISTNFLVLGNDGRVGAPNGKKTLGKNIEEESKDDGLTEAKQKIVEYLVGEKKNENPNCEVQVILPKEMTLQKQTVRGTNYILTWKDTTYKMTCPGQDGNEKTEDDTTDPKNCEATYTYVSWDKNGSSFRNTPTCQ